MNRTLRSLLILSLLGIASTAFADNDAVIRDATARFKEGRERYMKLDYEGARIALVQAYSVIKSTNILFALALAELNSGHELEALRHFDEYGRRSNADAEAKKNLPRLMERAQKATGHIKLDLPQGAALRLDGEELRADFAQPVDVVRGKHVLEATLGTRTQKIEVDARPGEVVPAKFDQLTEPPPVPSASSSGTTPVPTAPSASTSSTAATPPEPGFWNGRRTVGAVVAGAAVVSFGAALASALVANSKGDDAATFRANNPGPCANQQSATCGQYGSILDSRSTALDVKHGFLIGGAVLGVAGAALLLWPRTTESANRAWLAPSVGTRGAGLQVRGSF